MGNQPSTPQQRKLAKPRTSSSAPRQPLSATTRAVDPASQAVDPPTLPTAATNTGEVHMAAIGAPGDRRSLPGAFQKLRDHRRSLGGNDSINIVRDEDSAVGGLGAIVSEVKDRISRSGSLNSSRMSSARTSLTRFASLGGPPRLSLVIEPGFPDLGATALEGRETEENAWANELTLQHISSPSPTSEYSSNGPSCTPIRRKSLLTPGIATRGRPSNVLRKAPPPGELQTQADRDYYFNSSPTQLDALDLEEEGRRCLEQRAATPCDREFGVLGVFKRGTLRITNGAASPSPSERSSYNAKEVSPPSVRGESDEEYFSASEGRESLENGYVPISKRVIPRRIRRSIDASPGNPIQQERGEFDGIRKPLGASANGEWQSLLQGDMYFCESPAGIANEATTDKNCPLSPPEVPQKSPNRALKIAQQYIQELPSPASLISRCSSPAMDAPEVLSAGVREYGMELPDDLSSSTECLATGPISNSSAVTTDTLDDEVVGVSPVLERINDITHLVQRWSVGKDISDCNAYHADTQSSPAATSPATTVCTSSPEYPSYQPMFSRPLSKTDSGYGSQCSVKSVYTGSKTSQQDSGSSSCSERSASISNATSSLRLWKEQGLEVTHERPFRIHPSATPTSRTPSALQPSPPPADAVETTVIIIPPPKSKLRDLRKNLPPGTSQQAPPSLESQNLRRPRPILQPPVPPPRSSSITVQTYRSISQAHIPPPAPADSASKPVQRQSNYPPPIPKYSGNPKLSGSIPRPLSIGNNASLPQRSHSVIVRPGTDRGRSDLGVGSGSFRQRVRLTNHFPHEEASRLAHERSRTRSRSQGPISRVNSYGEKSGLTDRCQSVYAGKSSLVLPHF